MKIKSKIVAGSLLTIALAGGVVAGTTYALFTSDAKTEVDVTAGRVQVTSTINSVAAYTPKSINIDGTIADATDIADNTAAVKKFGLNGTVSIDGDKVVIERMMPGDKVTVKYKVSNESNVTIKQRDNIEVAADGGLASGLVCTYDGHSMVFGKTVWETKDVAGSVEHTVVIELPANSGNAYQEKSCTIRFSTEGVQANAAVKNVFAVKHTDGSETGYADLQSAFNAVKNNEIVVLNESATINKEINVDFDNSFSNVTFDGNENVLTLDIQEAGKDGIRFKDTITVQNLYVQGHARTGLHFRESSLDNVVKNVHVAGEYNMASIGFVDSSGGTVSNCSFVNSIDGEKAYYAPYNVPFALSMFANRASSHPVNITNSTVGMIFVNGSDDTFTEPKVNLGDNVYVDSGFNGSFQGDVVFSGTDKISGPIYWGENGLLTNEKEATPVNYYICNANGLVDLSAKVAGGNQYEGKTIKLLRNIDMSSVANFEPIGNHYSPTFGGTFDGGNFSIKNLKVSKTGTDANAGLFGSLHAGGQVENVIIDGADIQSEHYAGGIIGWLESGSITPNIKNCQVINSKIVSKTHFVDPKWDDGDKAGGIAGYVWGSNISNCLVKNCTIQGYRDIGGIAGILNSTGASVTDCRVEDCVLINDRAHNYKNYTTDAEYHVNEIIGEHAAGTESGNTFSGVTKQIIGA